MCNSKLSKQYSSLTCSEPDQPVFEFMGIDILSNFVVPILGILIAWALGLSPLKRVHRAEREGALGDYNPLPSTVFLINSIAWLFYAGLIDNVFLIVLKIVLIVINLQLTLASYRVASDDCRRQMEAVIHGGIGILMLFYILFYFEVSPYYLQQSFGYVCMVLNLLIFVAPFTTIRLVIASRDASRIYAPFAILGFFGSFFWFLYGLVISDIPLIVPNGIGALLNIFQLLLCFILKRENNESSNQFDGHDEMIQTGTKSCEPESPIASA